MNVSPERRRPGAVRHADGTTRFRVWAPRPRTIELVLVDQQRFVPLEPAEDGYFEVTLEALPLGARYLYRLNGAVDRPDPASSFQPQGVHQASEVMASDFAWTDASWRGRPWEEYVIYESHVGAFTKAGTFAAMIERLDWLVDLGVTAIEIMPVAQFPGARNWGYDGVHPYAAQNSYGGPDGFRKLIDACHTRGLAVVLDVVYNHLGPEGNYLAEFGPYFTERYRTPWGPALNYDGEQSRGVRDFFIDNALYWIEEFHVDGLRLDATHAIRDASHPHLLRELADAAHASATRLGRSVVLIAENNANDPQLTAPDGYRLDAQLVDDFQRSLHALATGEHMGFYADFGSAADFAKSYAGGFVLTGQPSVYRGQSWGLDGSQVPADKLVAYAQSHDTVGNRPGSQRLGQLVDLQSLKLAAAAAILSPSIPFLFMGEEYDDPAPFWFFTSFRDPNLVESVRKGRKRELSSFGLELGAIDPQAPRSLRESRLNCTLARTGHRKELRAFYQRLLKLRRDLPAVRQPLRNQASIRVVEQHQTIIARRWRDDQEICIAMNFSTSAVMLDESDWAPPWQLLLDSADSPKSAEPVSAQPANPATLFPRSLRLWMRQRH